MKTAVFSTWPEILDTGIEKHVDTDHILIVKSVVCPAYTIECAMVRMEITKFGSHCESFEW